MESGLGTPKTKSWLGHARLTFRIQQTCQPQVLLGRAEGSLQVVVGVGLGEFAEVHQIRPGKGTERTGSRRAPEPVGKWAKNTLVGDSPRARGVGGTTQPRGKLCVLAFTMGVRACVYLTS